MEDKDRYVTCHQALILKALGFNEPCDGYYDSFLGFWHFKTKGYSKRNIEFSKSTDCAAPTLIQAANWLRNIKKWDFDKKPDFTKYGYVSNHKFPSLESALSATIDVPLIELQTQQLITES